MIRKVVRVYRCDHPWPALTSEEIMLRAPKPDTDPKTSDNIPSWFKAVQHGRY
jgi:hypothetical protein